MSNLSPRKAPPLEVKISYAPHRLQHELLQQAYACLIPPSRRRLSSGKPSSGADSHPFNQVCRKEAGMTTKQVALYARVSSEQQAEAKTIESQLADLRERIEAFGFDLPPVLEFVDEGYSGSTLVRPALERLRDVAASGGMDRLYVHSPDRFARNYARSGSCWRRS
jgi:hypothetical protein